MRVVCEQYHGALVVHSSRKSCPLCRLRAEQRLLLGLLVQRGVLPPLPEDHSYWVREKLLTQEPGVVRTIDLLGPDCGQCPPTCTHEAFEPIPLEES